MTLDPDECHSAECHCTQCCGTLEELKGVHETLMPKAGNTKGGSITLPLTSCLTGLESTDNFCFYLPNRLIQTSQTGGQRYSDT
jgi:hypothetical protein